MCEKELENDNYLTSSYMNTKFEIKGIKRRILSLI